MIEAEHLSMTYGTFEALKDVSFFAPKGTVTGLLGPNGAGKSTLLRILMGLHPPMAGRVSVAGFDVFLESLEARKRIGYLPEHNALYPEMRIQEYLEFMGALKQLSPRQLTENIGRALEVTHLETRRRQIVGTLSKGLRQRVGIAATLLAMPEVIILDEPTVGLDPQQIQEIRDLIVRLGKEQTILFSTHLLPEVEMCCSRVLVLSEGRVVADDTLSHLTRGAALSLTVEDFPDTLLPLLRQLPGLVSAEKKTTPEMGGGVSLILIQAEGALGVPGRVSAFCAEHRLVLLGLQRVRHSLESIFLERVVGRSIPTTGEGTA